MAKKKGLTISKVRTGLYTAARILGDVSAVRNGTIGKRLARRVAGKLTGRGLGKVFK